MNKLHFKKTVHFANLTLLKFILWVFIGGQSVWAMELPDFTVLAEKSIPSVVKIESIYPNKFTVLGQTIQAPRSFGSGFIIDKKGYILTNQHVVDNAETITVTLHNEKQYKAQLIGTDKKTDVAILKIEKENLKNVVKLGNSDDIKIGEWVYAIGSPYGFDYSMSVGILSAKNRSLPNDVFVPYIQTDVAINKGNSGGPLFNIKGEVIGVNSRIISQTGGYEGISLSIPINIAKNVSNEIIANGYVRRGWLGVYFQPLTQDLAKSFNIEKNQGVLILRIVNNGPAEKAGLQSGDVILKYDGKKLKDSELLPKLVGNSKPGNTYELLILRNGKKIKLNVIIEILKDGSRPQSFDKKNNSNKTTTDYSKLGLKVKNLSQEDSKELKIQYNITGAIKVESVKSNSMAQQADINQGDYIFKINDTFIEKVDTFFQVEKYIQPNKIVRIGVIKYFGDISFITLIYRK